MKKRPWPILILLAILIMSILFVSINQNDRRLVVMPTTDSYFSTEADQAFIDSLGSDIDLNSGITLERSMALYADQRNNITFAVFNHTDEALEFANQGFGLTVFGYDDSKKTWEVLQLEHMPYPEDKLLPPKIEEWNFDYGNTWDILEKDTIALEHKQVRLYVIGKGTKTNIMYGAYLDVSLKQSP